MAFERDGDAGRENTLNEQRKEIWHEMKSPCLSTCVHCPPIRELFGILFTPCRWRNCAKSCTHSVFVSDVGHLHQREDVCEVAPILQSQNAL